MPVLIHLVANIDIDKIFGGFVPHLDNCRNLHMHNRCPSLRKKWDAEANFALVPSARLAAR